MQKISQNIHVKKEVLIRLIRAFYSKNFPEATRMIAYDMRPKGSDVPFRCCIHKERAILNDRVIANLGFAIEEYDDSRPLAEYAEKALERTELEQRPLTLIETACKACVPARIYVTDLCQGCVARPCISSCKFDAIHMVGGVSLIEQDKCKSCKLCIPACPYNAIVKRIVPCENSCPVDALYKDDNGVERIDWERCIFCGRCIGSCPFGAVHEKSQVIDVLKHIKAGKKVVAMLAPSIVGSFPGNIYQLKTAMMELGFHDIYEVAQGADVTTSTEAKDFIHHMEKGDAFMTTSCCAGYNNCIAIHMPEIKPFVSHAGTPLYYTVDIVKKEIPDSITVFFSPCTAKRKEGFDNPKIDYVVSYEELGSWLVAKEIDILKCGEGVFKVESSKQGRNFGLTAGVSQAVVDASNNPEAIKPFVINGLTRESILLLKSFAKTGKCANGNLIEVMCCEGGCVGGNAAITPVKLATKMVNDWTKDSKDIEKIS